MVAKLSGQESGEEQDFLEREAEETAVASQPVETKRTYCRICMVHCGLVADVAGDQIVKVRGDRDHPLTRGYTCPKGRATGRVHHLPGAITRPMMRVDGELVPVSWDEALDDIGAKLRRIIDKYGPDAVGMYFGSGLGLDSSGYVMEEAFYRALGTPPKFSPLTNDGTAKVMVAGTMGGFLGLNPKTDYDNVEMLIYVGTNPMVSHAHNTGMFNPAVWIRAAARRGEVWTIDPVFTETAKWSTRHIAAYPGKDYAILAWLTREILDGGPLDLQQPVNGLAELRAALEGYDRAKAADIAGVTEQELEDLLAAVRRQGRVAVETGTGITMSAGCNMTQWFAWLHHDPDRRDESQGRCVVPSRLPLAVRDIRIAGRPERPDARTEDPARREGHHGRLALRGASERNRGREHPRVLQLRRQPAAFLPRHQCAQRRAREARAECEYRDRRERNVGVVHARPADQGCGRAGGIHALGHAGLECVAAIHPAAGRAAGRAALGLVGAVAIHEAGGTAGSQPCTRR